MSEIVVKPAEFKSFLQRAHIGERTVLEFDGEKFFCKASPANKSFVNYQEYHVGGTKLPMNYRFYSMGLKKFIDTLGLYITSNRTEVKLIFDIKDTKDPKDQTPYVQVLSIKLSAKGMTTTMNSADLTLLDQIVYMPDRAWGGLCSEADFFHKCTFKPKFITELNKISELNTEEGKLPTVKVNFADGKLNFSSKKQGQWQLDFDGEYGTIDNPSPTSFSYVFNMNVFGYLDKSKAHDFYVKKASKDYLILVSEDKIGKYMTAMAVE